MNFNIKWRYDLRWRVLAQDSTINMAHKWHTAEHTRSISSLECSFMEESYIIIIIALLRKTKLLSKEEKPGLTTNWFRDNSSVMTQWALGHNALHSSTLYSLVIRWMSISVLRKHGNIDKEHRNLVEELITTRHLFHLPGNCELWAHLCPGVYKVNQLFLSWTGKSQAY